MRLPASSVQDYLDCFFLEHSDVKFESCGLVVNPKYPFMGASPDRLVLDCSHTRLTV